MPPLPKPKERRQRRNKPKDAGSISVLRGEGDTPNPPANLSETGTREWHELWASPLAKTYDLKSDLPALQRLFSLREKVERYERESEVDGLVTNGSKGQLIIHPLMKQADVLRSQIVQLEDRFGLSPMARLKLGVTLGDATRSLEDLNKRLMSDLEDEDTDDFDPRLSSDNGIVA